LVPAPGKDARQAVDGALLSDAEKAMAADLGKIEEIAERVAQWEGMTLIDVEVKGGEQNSLLRVYIDKPGGVTHADCQLVSEQMSAILDVEDLFPGRYLLEVSSPGLTRKLVKPAEYGHFAGRRARLVLRDPVAGQKVFEGKLGGLDGERVRLEMGEGRVAEFDLSNISKAQLVAEF
jgi:ribosome maturation factor RimP